MKNIFVINGHEYYPYAQGELNKTLFQTIVENLADDYEVHATIIQEGYDIEEEQQKFLNADAVIYQFPINWMGMPFSMKKYVDHIFAHGVFFGNADRYGSGGLLLNKKYMLSTTWNAPKEAFDDVTTFFGGRSVDDVLLPIHKSMEYVGMKALPGFSCHDVVKNPQVDQYLEDLKMHIKSVFHTK